MNTALFENTPMVSVRDNRGLQIREIVHHRHPDALHVTDVRVTHHQYDARGFIKQSADPRMRNADQVNFIWHNDLTGNKLRTQSVDAGNTLILNDVAGRPLLQITGEDSGEHKQIVTRTWEYEDNSLSGRLLAVVEQIAGQAACTLSRFVYAGNTLAEKALNLAGMCISHYDNAGVIHTSSMSLTGVPLSVTRLLIKDADSPDTIIDWQGTSPVQWNTRLDPTMHTTMATADATGRQIITTDAAGNRQRVAYNVAGLLCGSWATLKDGQEQVILKAMEYSAAGQKLREEHGNGVVTTYMYEPQTQRLASIQTARPAGHSAGAKVLQNLRYTYDPVGNVLSMTDDAQEARFWRNQKVVPENTYSYDSLYQLISATGREMANAGQQGSNLPLFASFDNVTYTRYTRSYTYDIAGNLTQIRHSSPATNNNYTTDITISNHSNRGVLSSLTENPTEVDALFTADGCQKQMQPGQSLLWTAGGELMKVTPVSREGASDDNEYYRYDANSQRILKVCMQKMQNVTQINSIVYLPGLELRTLSNNQITAESLQSVKLEHTGRAQVRILHWVKGKPDGINNDQVRWSYDDLTGSCGLEVDGAGNLISQEEYYPFGGTAVFCARNFVEANYKTIRYSGKERDKTGLYYYGYRYYQPWAGRWLSADPAGTVDGLNLYKMVGNNPVSFHDTDGLKREGQEARALVAEAFVHPLHMPVFERISVQENMAMSVREAGTFTITALGEGAAAKGHNILEKTIKPGSLKGAYGAKADSVLQQAQSSGFVGRVGQWNKSGVNGVYAHNKVSGDDRAYPVNLQNKSDNDLVNAWVKFGKIVPYTGDYDMHDIIQYAGGAGSVPAAESAAEKGVKDLINRGVAEVDPARPFNDTAMNVIRHGPQVNFVPYMWEHEYDKVVADDGYLGIVARPGPFPVAMVHEGQWTIYENSDELFDFYKSTNTMLPEHWQQDFVERGKGIVATPGHANILNTLKQQRAG